VVSSAVVEIAEYSLVAIQVQGINEDRPIPLDLETVRGSINTPPSPDCPPESCSHGKRDGNILVQATPLEDLRMISQARGARNLAALPGYAYDSASGMGITVYVMDTGVNPNHPVSVTDLQKIIAIGFTHLQEFTTLPGSIRWLHLPNEPHVENDTDADGHGSCVASKIAGRTVGVAKNVNLVIVKAVPDPSRAMPASQYIAAWAIVARDIETARLRGRAVVSISMGCKHAVY
jgi:subtilisin family serine protease